MGNLVERGWGGIIGSMDDLKKQAVGYRSGGFMQVRKGTRPLHVETLLQRKTPESAANIFEPVGPTATDRTFEQSLAATAGEEFQPEEKVAELRRDKSTDKPTQVDPKVVESVKIRSLGIKDGKKVFLVDGAKVRNRIDTDFALGGNSARYSYVPEGELWVEQTGPTVDKDEKETIKHEDHEENLMRRGANYNQAHGEATKEERADRSKQASVGEFVGRLTPLMDDAAILAWRAYQDKQGKKQEIQEPKVGEVKKSSLITDLEKSAGSKWKAMIRAGKIGGEELERIRAAGHWNPRRETVGLLQSADRVGTVTPRHDRFHQAVMDSWTDFAHGKHDIGDSKGFQGGMQMADLHRRAAGSHGIVLDRSNFRELEGKAYPGIEELRATLKKESSNSREPFLKVVRYEDPTGTGIYRAVEKKDHDAHDALLKSNYKWLKKPEPHPQGKLRSFFTETGAQKYEKITKPEHDKITKVIKHVMMVDPKSVRYTDKDQIVAKVASVAGLKEFAPDFPNGKVRESGMAKIAAEAVTAGPKEFAPGIPTGRVVQRIPSVKESGPNAEWTASLALHPAAKRGDHYDLRLVDSQGRAHSWAINSIPELGKSTYAAQMPTHSGAYAKRTEPFTIPINVYGGTRPGAQVEPKYVQPVEVISANDNRVHLLRHEGQKTEELVLRRVAMAGDQTPIWALHNATRTRSTQEGQRLPDSKPKYQDIPIGSVDINNDQQLMTAKIDGAHTIVDFYKPDRMVRTYSYRPTQRESGVIEHTFKFPSFQNMKTPPSLKGTMIRAETWASDSAGRAVPASEIGGLLNSSVVKSRQAQQEGNITLRRTGIDVIRYNGKDMSTAPYERKLEILREVNKATKGAIELPIAARTPEEKAELLNAVKAGRLPETREGVVLHDLNSSMMMKAKVRPDTDVYVREIVTKPLTEVKGQAAGFKYSLEPTGPIVGHVGTGFSTQLRKEMLKSPDSFVGRVAKVQSSGQHVNRSGRVGALVGSPAFKEWHIDKTPPELMKEATSIGDVVRRVEQETDPEVLAGRLMETSRTARALRPIIGSSIVKPKLLKLRDEYQSIIGEKPGD